MGSIKSLKMINEPQNYLRRYPFILNERHSSVGKVIENTYSMRTRHKSANDKMECKLFGWNNIGKDSEDFSRRPLTLIKTSINCAPRRSSPAAACSMATALSMAYRKGSRTRNFSSSGPTRYKIDNEFQSRFCP